MSELKRYIYIYYYYYNKIFFWDKIITRCRKIIASFKQYVTLLYMPSFLLAVEPRYTQPSFKKRLLRVFLLRN